MSPLLKLFGFFAVTGLLVNSALRPETPTATLPARAAISTSTPPAQVASASEPKPAPAVPPMESTLEGQAAIKRVEDCLRRNACAYHLVGIATYEPTLQLSVIAETATRWTGADFLAAEHLARQTTLRAKAEPSSAIKQYEGLAESAPFFPKAVANVAQRLDRYSVAVVTARKKRAPRSGVPGWMPDEDRVQRAVLTL